MAMKVLVTGGGGFLGTATCKELVAEGFEVCSFSRSAYPHLKAIGVRCIIGDITKKEDTRAACTGIDAIFHIAAKAGVWGSYASYFGPNVLGTRNIIQACLKNNIRYLVHTSSPSVTFSGFDQNGVNEDAPYASRFLTPYQETKAIAEQEVLSSHGNKLQTIVLRPHLIWGPGDNQLVPRIVKLAKSGKLRIVGNGTKRVDAVYIANAAQSQINALAALRRGQCGGESFFITNHEPWPMRDIIGGILKPHGLPSQPKKIPTRAAYSAGSLLEAYYKIRNIETEPRMTRFVAKQLSTAHWFDPKKSKDLLGYNPKISMQKGMQLLKEAVHGETYCHKLKH